MGGAERGCGMILRGAGGAGAAACGAGGGAAAVRAPVTTAGFEACGAAATGALATTGRCGWRASASSSFFRASTALSTSPGLEMLERSILGAIVCTPRADALFCPAGRVSRWKCPRIFSASSSSSELECVLPPPTPISGRMSRIARDLTSSSFARSLIRTLLIRLFSKSCRQKALPAHIRSVALAACKTCVNVPAGLRGTRTVRAILTRFQDRPPHLFPCSDSIPLRWRESLPHQPDPGSLPVLPLGAPRRSFPLRLLHWL
jgi:hypothetical protein